MAASGFFTYHDLYAGRAKEYHSKTRLHSLASTTHPFLPISTTPRVASSTASEIVRLTSLTPALSKKDVPKLVQITPFAYFHWFLVLLAAFLTLILAIIFVCYCRNHWRKTSKHRKEKKRQSLPSFYRNRAPNRRLQTYNIYESTVPLFFSSPANAGPSKSFDCDDSQLLRQGLDAVGSPQTSRIAGSCKEPPSAFTDAASNLLAEIKDRLNAQPSKPSLGIEQVYETQRAKMALNDESKADSVLVAMK